MEVGEVKNINVNLKSAVILMVFTARILAPGRPFQPCLVVYFIATYVLLQ